MAPVGKGARRPGSGLRHGDGCGTGGRGGHRAACTILARLTTGNPPAAAISRAGTGLAAANMVACVAFRTEPSTDFVD